MRQGGLGIVDRETYIVVDEARNAVIVGGKQWDGLPRRETEVVVTDGLTGTAFSVQHQRENYGI
jgi:hypothetical protein